MSFVAAFCGGASRAKRRRDPCASMADYMADKHGDDPRYDINAIWAVYSQAEPWMADQCAVDLERIEREDLRKQAAGELYSDDTDSAMDWLARANGAILGRQPKQAFEYLYQAEIAHHSQPDPDPGVAHALTAAWGRFGKILPSRV